MLLLDVPLSFLDGNGIAIDGRSTYIYIYISLISGIQDPVNLGYFDTVFRSALNVDVCQCHEPKSAIWGWLMPPIYGNICARLLLGLPLKKMKETLAELDHTWTCMNNCITYRLYKSNSVLIQPPLVKHNMAIFRLKPSFVVAFHLPCFITGRQLP